MSKSTKISVCIATYNGAEYIKAQLLSILPQLASCDEVIISDDGSTDDTIAIINTLNDARITIFNGDFRNLVKNFEHAILKSSGDLILLSDQDDIWMPNKVEKIRHLLDLGYDIVLHDCKVVTSDFKVVIESYFKSIDSRPGLIRNIIKRNSYMGCCIAFSSRMKPFILPFPKRIPMHDSWIGLIGELMFRPFFLEEKLILYRQHQNNSSDTSTGISKYSLFKKIEFRIITVYYLMKRFYKMKFS